MKNTGRHATLTDVARKAAVGVTTVSRVVNGGARVSPVTLARVQAAIDRLGYVPNHAARILKGDRTRTVGLVIPSIADPFFASCAEAAQEVARAYGSLLVVTTSGDDPRAEMESLRVLTSHRTDGVLIAPAASSNAELASFLRSTKLPAVCFDRPLFKSGVCSVTTDNVKGARLATEHLISHGYRRILCLGPNPGLWTIHERLQGYREAMAAAGLRAAEDMTVTDYAAAESIIGRHAAAAKPPQAIFALKNSTTIYAYEVLQKLRMRMPGRMGLFGFDDFELAATLGISLVQQPIENIGHIAAELLVAQLTRKSRLRSRKSPSVKLMPNLVLRSSCGCGPTARRVTVPLD